MTTRKPWPMRASWRPRLLKRRIYHPMAILTQSDENRKHLLGEPCSYCGAPVHEPAVLWVGRDPNLLLLHTTCCRDLSLQLIREKFYAEHWAAEHLGQTRLAALRACLMGQDQATQE